MTNLETTGYDKDENFETIVTAHKDGNGIVIDGIFQTPTHPYCYKCDWTPIVERDASK